MNTLIGVEATSTPKDLTKGLVAPYNALIRNQPDGTSIH